MPPSRQFLGSVTSGSISAGGIGSRALAGMNVVSRSVMPFTNTSQRYLLAPRSDMTREVMALPELGRASTAMPGYLASKASTSAALMLSPGGTMTETVPSFLAAATRPSQVVGFAAGLLAAGAAAPPQPASAAASRTNASRKRFMAPGSLSMNASASFQATLAAGSSQRRMKPWPE